jgi:CubicO group peptidase (beta-lactamase class C family)
MKVRNEFKYQRIILTLFIMCVFSCDGILDDLLSNQNISETVNPTIDAIIKEEMANQEIVGLAVGVVENGRVTHLKGYGYSDWDQTIATNINTRYRWASISKSVTAVAAMKLVEDGKLNLTEDITDNYLPSYPQNDITMHHLLSNSSGIPHYAEVDYDPNVNYPNNSTWNATLAVDLFDQDTLVNDPGDDYHYSTFGFILAGAVIESITQKEFSQSFVEYVQENIADVGGMNSFTEDYQGLSLAARSEHYSKNCNNVITKVGRSDVSWRLPGGGFVSDIKDATLFLKGMLADQFLSESSKSQMYMGQSPNNLYGYGFFRSTVGGIRMIEHGGNQPGTNNLLGFFPNEEKGIVILCNSDYFSRYRILQRIADAIGISNNAPSHDLFAATDCGTKISGDDRFCEDVRDDIFAGVWTPGNAETIIRRGYKSENFLELRDQLVAFGFTLIDFEPYQKGNEILWDMVFRKETRQIITWRNASQDNFLDKYNEFVADGYRLVDLEQHEGSNGNRLWSGIFDKKTGGHALWRNFDTEGFNQKWQEMANQGLRLIDVETYLANDGTRLWAGVWEAGSYDYKLNRNYTTDDFGDLRNTYRSQGFNLVDVETYIGSQGQRLWAGVWKKNNQGEALWRNWGWCGILEKHNDAMQNGLELIDLETY